MDIDLDIIGIEVKRRKSLKLLRDWMAQVRKAVRDKQRPALIVREDGGEWMVILPLQEWLDNLDDEDYDYIQKRFASKPTDTKEL